MSLIQTPASSFDVLANPGDDQLVAAAAAASTRAAYDVTQGIVVIVARPGTDTVQVVSGGGTGVLRAAVSVAVAAGNDRVWRAAPDGDTVEQPTSTLPEVIRAAAEAAGVRAVHTGIARRGDVVDVIAMWFETAAGVADADERRLTLTELARAAAIDAERAAQAPAAVDEVAVETQRLWDASDPRLDALTGVLNATEFMALLEDYEREEANLLLIDLDRFASVAETWGDEVSDLVLRTTADRILTDLRRDDVVGRLGHDRFAVLFGDLERSMVLQIGKRIIAQIAEPLGLDEGPANVTATVALAHQMGLVDLEEMLDSAGAALRSGKLSGEGRLILAA